MHSEIVASGRPQAKKSEGVEIPPGDIVLLDFLFVSWVVAWFSCRQSGAHWLLGGPGKG